MTVLIDWKNESVKVSAEPNSWKASGGYRCHIMVFREDDCESWSAAVLNLPGVFGCGDSAEEAFASAKEGAIAAIRSYKEEGMEIPWTDSDCDDMPPSAVRRWVLVDA
jgi:predicted RNase H-like HicB family nuclease